MYNYIGYIAPVSVVSPCLAEFLVLTYNISTVIISEGKVVKVT
jgi:hypothetical protein